MFLRTKQAKLTKLEFQGPDYKLHIFPAGRVLCMPGVDDDANDDYSM
jgi:hypothetical protein